jgi:hypothetical protein
MRLMTLLHLFFLGARKIAAVAARETSCGRRGSRDKDG